MDASHSLDTRQYKLGILPLSADPVTYGHLNLIERAARACQELLVLVCDNDTKRGSYLFTREERTAFVERAVRRLRVKNVRVQSSARLLVDEFLEAGADVLFRGIRDEKDRREDEQQMRYHSLILPGFADKVVYLEAEPALRELSSTFVKAFASHYLEIGAYVPMFVKVAVEERIAGQWKLAITGEMASGKTWVARELATVLNARGYPTTVVNFDELVRTLYAEDSGGAAQVREELARRFGDDVLTADRKNVDRALLSQRLFAPETSAETRRELHALTAPHVERLYRAALKKARGIVLVEWAQLAEMGLGALTNHRVIVVESPDRGAFFTDRKVPKTLAANVAAFQWSADKKAEALAHAAERDGAGLILRYKNRRVEHEGANSNLEALADEVLSHIPSSFKQK